MNDTMQNSKPLRTPEEVARRQGLWLTIVCLVIFYVLLFVLDNFVKPSKFILMLIPVLKKGAIYSLLCVSMNLLNGFTGLFSLGQAGFMLVGAYAYSIFSIPAAQHPSVYQYFEGGAIQFSIPEILGNALGVDLGSFLGAIICIIIAGLVAAVFAALIGIPVLRLKSDYLAIATLGFAEIIRAIFQWNGLGVITNGSNLLRKYTAFSDMKFSIGGQVFKFGTAFPFLIAMICILIIVLLINSSYGRAFKAIRDDEVAAGPGVEVELRALEVADDGVALVAADAEGVGGEFVAAVAERKHLAGEELHGQHFRFGGGQRRLDAGMSRADDGNIKLSRNKLFHTRPSRQADEIRYSIIKYLLSKCKRDCAFC